MSEELTTEDLEEMFGDPPPICEIKHDGEQCCNDAAFTLACKCNRCGHIPRVVFVCKPCHDRLVRPDWHVVCNICPRNVPMECHWRPL